MQRTIPVAQLVSAVAETVGRADGSTLAVVSSRLGRDPSRHRQICRYLSRSMLDCRSRQRAVVVASGSAIEPWAVRAAELFAVPLVRIAIDNEKRPADLIVASDGTRPLSRDEVVIESAERVDAVYVRRGGEIEKLLRRRIATRGDGTTRVAVTLESTCAAERLIAAGAVGWHLTPRQLPLGADTLGTGSTLDAAEDWTRTPDRWLVHCTRGSTGPWPGETFRQYRDAILLADDRASERRPIDALARIVRSGRLVAGATATSAHHPVVCFSGVPLLELLARRCFRPHLGRWDYEPYGVALRRTAAERIGIQRVIYGDPSRRATLKPADRFRFHPVGKTFDWQTEQEWRSAETVDLHRLSPADVHIFALESPASRQHLAGSPWPVTFLSGSGGQAI